MRKFSVTGMSCAACQAAVEKAVSKVPGVESVAVSLLTNSMGVEGNASEEDIIRAVVSAGYGAEAAGREGTDRKTGHGAVGSGFLVGDPLSDHETPVLLRRLLASLGFLLVLMYFSMGHHMWGWPVPGWFQGNPVALGLLQMILSAIVMLINKKFFVSGFQSAVRRSPNMDTLVAMGSSASFLWSVYALFMMTGAQVRSGSQAAMEWMDEFYFESAAMILVLITVGKMLEARSKGKTTDALKALMKLAPERATVIREGKEVSVPVSEVQKGDIFVVRPGESIPGDGIVLEGDTAVDESALTGESIPVDRKPGDRVFQATINRSGFIRCEATRVGEDTTLSQIIQMVSDAAATKAPVQRIADSVSAVFVPVVLLIALLTLTGWILLGKPFDFALARAISVLVISCPCALGLATPVAIMVGSGVGAKNGVLFKTGSALEETGKAQIVVLDKTGTVTEGMPVVTEILPEEGSSEAELLRLAVSLESKSEHPLSKAIVREAEKREILPHEVTDFRALPGNGLTGKLEGETLRGGSLSYIGEEAAGGKWKEKAVEFSERGLTPLLFAKEGRVQGIIAVSDQIKEEAPVAVAELENMGVRVIMLTGDNERTARAAAAKAGIRYVIAGVLPQGKEAVIRKLKELGKVAMVGDGINDAPALTAADTGIAIGRGADVAVDAASVVLMKSRLTDVPAAVRLSRQTFRNIKENLFWAFFYNILCIPLAAGCYTGIFGWTLNPMIGAAAMSLSSFFVVSNALRLNLFDMKSGKKDRKLSREVPEAKLSEVIEAIRRESEKRKATKVLKIDGMMCPHCEARVKKALEEVPGVENAVPDFHKGEAVLTLSGEVKEGDLIKAVIDAGYEVIPEA